MYITLVFPLIWKNRDAVLQLRADLLSFRNTDIIKKQLHNRPIYYFVTIDLNSETDSAIVNFK